MPRPVAIITGASRGIGASTALRAARAGYAVGVNYLGNQAAAEEVVGAIRAQGGEALPIQADVSQEADVVRLFDTVTGELGPITALVNNAGIVGPPLPLADMEVNRVRHMFEVNTISVFLCLREGVRRMSTKRGGAGGAIVNVSSIASRLGSPNEYADYAASKAAVDTMTIGLAKEVAMEGIRVNCVRPGMTYTEIHASGGQPGRVDRLKSAVPMQRGGQPEEIANAIVWLLSGEASYMTGALVDVGGGR